MNHIVWICFNIVNKKESMFIPSIKSIFIIILSLVILFLSYFYTQNYFSDISTKTLIIFLSSFFLAILILDFILSKMFSSKSKIHHSDLFSSIKNKSLDDFKQYLSKNRLSQLYQQWHTTEMYLFLIIVWLIIHMIYLSIYSKTELILIFLFMVQNRQSSSRPTLRRRNSLKLCWSIRTE